MSPPFSFYLKLLSIFCFITILLSPSVFSKHSNNRSSKRASFGSPCNSSVKCDIHSLLMCEDNVCQCLYPDAMAYNTELGTCVSLVNEICGYLETKRVFINCIPNAYCDQQQGMCKCTQGYVEGGRHCMKQKSFGESCHSDNECLSELSLTCFEEVCQCDPNRFVAYNTEENLSDLQYISAERPLTKCWTLAGLPCTATTGCVKKASCVSSETETEIVIPSSALGWRHPGICKCDVGYEMDENRHCRGQYGFYCDVLANISCESTLQCLDGICHCKYPDDQVYNEEMGKCVSLVGGPCSAVDGQNDVPMDNEEAFRKGDILCDKCMECRNFTCTCKSGFEENLKRGCDLGYGQLCTGEEIRKCDAAAGLYCVNGRCTCKDVRMEYDMKTGRCVGKIGSSCKISRSFSAGAGHTEQIDDGKHSCSDSGKCQVSRSQLEGLSSRGFCVLSTGGTDVPMRVANPENTDFDLENQQEN